MTVWINRWIGRVSPAAAFPLLCCAYLVCWTIYPLLSAGDLDRHTDMAEAYTWSLEPAYGYPKHPPFLPWIVAAWFQVMPVTSWAFNFLSAINGVVALVGVWALAGLFVQGPVRLMAVLALAVTPFYTVLALKLNANSILLPLWPWAAWAAIRAIDLRSNAYAVLAATLAAAAMLSKYISVLALAPILAAVAVRPNFLPSIRSTLPVLVVATFAAIIAPHIIWLINTDYGPIRYAGHARANGIGHLLGSILRFAGAQLLIMAPAVLVVAVAGRRLGTLGNRAGFGLAVNQHKELWILALGPILLLLLAGLLTQTRLTTPWGIPFWFALPLALLVSCGAVISERQSVAAALAVIAMYVGFVVASPVLRAIPYLRQEAKVLVPYRALAGEMTALWRERTGRPLRLVAGSPPAVRNISFYSLDHPRTFEHFSPRLSPWATSERIAKHGLLVMCLKDDDVCGPRARSVHPDVKSLGEITRRSTYLGLKGPETTFEIYMVAPQPQ